jgi:hypothetical protein
MVVVTFGLSATPLSGELFGFSSSSGLIIYELYFLFEMHMLLLTRKISF